MSGTRNRYTSAPMYGMKHRKNLQQADFTPQENEEPAVQETNADEQYDYARYPQEVPYKRKNATWLILLTALILPILFVVSFITGSNILRIIFLVCAFMAILVMLLGKPFGKHARTSLSLVYTALMVVVAVALIVSLPTTPSRRSMPAPTNAANRVSSPVEDTQPTVLPADDDGSGASVSQGSEIANDAGSSAAQLQLMAFMNYWGENKLDQMITLCKPDWVNNQENPKSALFILLKNRTPLSYSVEAVSGNSADDSRTITITALISKASNTSPEYYRMQVLMIRINNNWYVDPNSLNTSKVTVTAAPDGSVQTQTTVPTSVPEPTQVPTANTVLYYNPDGGQYYHAVNNCSKVAAKYLPLQPLYYSDLNSTNFKGLLPCPGCKPPERPSITGN